MHPHVILTEAKDRGYIASVRSIQSDQALYITPPLWLLLFLAIHRSPAQMTRQIAGDAGGDKLTINRQRFVSVRRTRLLNFLLHFRVRADFFCL